MDTTKDVKKVEDGDVKETDGAKTDSGRVIITEDDMLWLGNCSIKGVEQTRLF